MFIGILFTFLCVDTIIQRHEWEQWVQTNARIFRRIERLAFATITNCRISFGFGRDIFWPSIMGDDPEEIQAALVSETIRIAKSVARESYSPSEKISMADTSRGLRRLLLLTFSMIFSTWQNIYCHKDTKTHLRP